MIKRLGVSYQSNWQLRNRISLRVITWKRRFRRKCCWDYLRRKKSVSRNILSPNLSPDLSRIATDNATESRSGWTKLQQMYEDVHPSLALELFFERTNVGKVSSSAL